MPRRTAKENLHTKVCQTCNRPFTWRKKWARDWDSVKYCSNRCRAGRSRASAGGVEGDRGP
ncbi:DUF2256 domain-containing protein [Palleronia sediminis]|uniref:DUF2256 domain-containing protein n=2 Tax=Palleronia sediminis TaxID=2547833 RepID=A0A4R6AE58_9RHOB|nr:DUF2256 domain-containing protein [Palleronia sediminis]TDL79746.1 DUF2256 domain-containing protein [Palleronia sediminis]